jgi:micrococcal nuclease
MNIFQSWKIPLRVWAACAIWVGLLLCGWAPARAERRPSLPPWSGEVVSVTDGDTLWIRHPDGGPPRSVRIEGIDAPEICQPWGPQSREALKAVVLHRVVTVAPHRLDTYGRWLAVVRFQHDDVGARMVREGWAWSYRFRQNPGPYTVQERWARTRRVGLFVSASPEMPRDFRRRSGSCHASRAARRQ